MVTYFSTSLTNNVTNQSPVAYINKHFKGCPIIVSTQKLLVKMFSTYISPHNYFKQNVVTQKCKKKKNTNFILLPKS